MEKGMVKKALQRNVARYTAAAAAALVAIFVVTNGVSYAATGETWIEKATVFVNGEPKEMDVHMTRVDDETTIGEITYEVSDESAGGDINMSFTVEGGEPGFDSIEINDYTVGDRPDGGENIMVLESSDGKIVIAPEGVEPIDVTQQVKYSGGATGTFVRDGITYVYKVAGEPGDYHATAEPKDAAAAPMNSAEL